jgi:hypothetical protein
MMEKGGAAWFRGEEAVLEGHFWVRREILE